jgi:hypothetical protein
LGSFLDSRKDDLPDWFHAVVPPLRVAGYLWLPFLMAAAVWGFLRYQHRIDAHDPKLTEAPMYEEESPVTFED